MTKVGKIVLAVLFLLFSLSITEVAFSGGLPEQKPAPAKKAAPAAAKPLKASAAVEDEEKEGLVEGMNQGDFAMALVKALEAEGLLPPGATEKDYFKFLEQLGVMPPNGWDAEGVITKEDLIKMLGLTGEEAADAVEKSFEELADELVSALKEELQNVNTQAIIQNVSPTGG
jgi:hypothetical protein